MTSLYKGRFKVVRPLKEDIVYLCYDTRMNNRPVVVKILTINPNSSEKLLYLIEKEAMNAISHPNIVHLYDVLHENNNHYFIMEYIDGNPIADQNFKLEDILDICIQIADALEFLHSKKIIHRDIKPSNILLNRRLVKLIDFGIVEFSESRYLEDYKKLQSEYRYSGTLMYSSPEQDACNDITISSDIYSFGCVIYEMLIGKFYKLDYGNIYNDVKKHYYTYNSSVIEQLTDMVTSTLSVDPEKRPNALEVKETLMGISKELTKETSGISLKLFSAVAILALLIITLLAVLPTVTFRTKFNEYALSQGKLVIEKKGPSEAIHFFHVINLLDDSASIESSLGIARCYYEMGNYEAASKILKDSLELSTNHEDIGNIYISLANIAMQQCNKTYIEAYLRLAAGHYAKTANPIYAQYMQRKNAEVLFFLGDYERAAAAFKKVEQPTSNSVFHLALCYNALGKFNEANKLLSELSTTLNKDGDNRLRAKVIGSLGWSDLNLKNYEKAFANIKESKEMSEHLGMVESAGHAMIDLIHYHIAMGDIGAAKYYLNAVQDKPYYVSDNRILNERIQIAKAKLQN